MCIEATPKCPLHHSDPRVKRDDERNAKFNNNNNNNDV